jgi:probable HAF family extracellular repeat protein
MDMTHQHLRLTILSALLISLASAVAFTAQALPPKYRIEIIHKTGWRSLVAVDFNNAGQVAGLLCTDECYHTFLFESGAVTDIKTNLGYVIAQGMNSAGDIVGYWYSYPDDGAFVYIDGVFQALPLSQTLPAGEFIVTSAVDINSSRQVVGFGYFPTEGIGRGFIWENGTLSLIPNGPFENVGHGPINNAGQVAGAANFSNIEGRAFLYSDGKTSDLGTVPGAEAILPRFLSGTGITAGHAYMFPPGGPLHAVRSKNGAMIDLGTLGGEDSLPNAINNAGYVVGDSQIANGQGRAFLHDGESMRNLGTLGGTFSSARDITDNGQIVGQTAKADATKVGFIYGFGTQSLHDLNSLVDPADPLKTKVRVQDASHVNEFGQIVASGLDSRVNKTRLMLLTPVDSTKPVVSSKLTGTKGTNGWYKSNVSLAWTVSDEEAPIGSDKGCDSASVTTDTAGREFTCVAKSIGGRTSKSVTVKRDATRPAVAITRPAPGVVFNRNQVVTAKFACSDATAGVKSCVGTVANGARIDTSHKVTNATFSVKATDKAGLTRTLTTTYSVN